MSITFSEACSYGPGGRGANIGYSIVDSALGRLLVAGTRHGLCFAALGDSDRAITSELRADYPKATIHRDDALAGKWARAIAKNLGGGSPIQKLPLDIRGTPFQRSVWDQLRAIPRGATRSYTEIARRIGRPRAIRAVGTANGANPVAIVIPCHRALRASGHLGGYRWGLERKRRLLELEAAHR
jgi:AraC family transcriptional regulator, regulatory protein of adaptative response / methylated-DNA-[protein]-cysteine methyltransferase